MRILIHNKIIWYLKQLFPLPYSSNYKDELGNSIHSHWWMWFGRCFRVQHWKLVERQESKMSEDGIATAVLEVWELDGVD